MLAAWYRAFVALLRWHEIHATVLDHLLVATIRCHDGRNAVEHRFRQDAQRHFPTTGWEAGESVRCRTPCECRPYSVSR